MSNMISDFFKGKSKAGGPIQSGGTAARRGQHVEPLTGLPAAPGMESPYVAARREWNERYGSYIARARTWQIVALSSMALSGVLGLCVVKIASQSKVQPFIVQVDQLGQAVAVKPADTAGMPDQRIVRYQLANFIYNARSVTPDAIVQKRWLDAVYAVSASSAASFLNDYYKKSDPFAKARTSMVNVDIKSALPLSKNTWQIQWEETSRGLNGQVDGMTRWQAVLTINYYAPTTPAQILANPTGIVIEQINWNQQL